MAPKLKVSSTDLTRFIKDKTGTKTELMVTSVNITRSQHAYLKKSGLSLSLICREVLDDLMSRK